MSKKHYIKLVDNNHPKDDRLAFYYGPFDKKEIKKRMNDLFAKTVKTGDMGHSHTPTHVKIADKDLDGYFINSRQYWMDTLALLEARLPKRPGLVWRLMPFTPWS